MATNDITFESILESRIRAVYRKLRVKRRIDKPYWNGNVKEVRIYGFQFPLKQCVAVVTSIYGDLVRISGHNVHGYFVDWFRFSIEDPAFDPEEFICKIEKLITELLITNNMVRV